MSDFVLDASISLSWFVDNPVPDAARDVRDLLVKGRTGLVPALWLFEMANGFLTAERRQILTSLEVSACVDELEILLAGGIEVAHYSQAAQVRDLTITGRRYSLTGYDASYFALAQKERVPLLTLDRSLQAAAKKAGLPLQP
ncbi:MAG TPA: type II toxin-antitoxin system VapC family toxin [Candidatus Acidoferrum sp.]|nr:type II toxin-antitoxin system VapC family toxin [Candidatus Acidoferrum sp.]